MSSEQYMSAFLFTNKVLNKEDISMLFSLLSSTMLCNLT